MQKEDHYGEVVPTNFQRMIRAFFWGAVETSTHGALWGVKAFHKQDLERVEFKQDGLFFDPLLNRDSKRIDAGSRWSSAANAHWTTLGAGELSCLLNPSVRFRQYCDPAKEIW
jgi:hypothetical protein